MLLTVGDLDTTRLLGYISLYGGLRRLGRTVTLVRYPNQEHELAGSALSDYLRRVDEFLDHYLQR
jgi:dipeptidyl aminopeptidase/acylaminoacyl peptidase